MKFYKNPNWRWHELPHLPQIPNLFLEEFSPEFYTQRKSLFHKRQDRELTYKDGHKIYNSNYDRYLASDGLQQWVRENVCADFIHVGISIIDPAQQSRSLGPHTDASRDAGLLYTITTGGPEVDTVFYHEVGQPILQQEKGRFAVDYNIIKEIDRARFKENSWTILHTHIMHSVENLVTPRIALHISLDYQHLDKIIKPSGQ